MKWPNLQDCFSFGIWISLFICCVEMLTFKLLWLARATKNYLFIYSFAFDSNFFLLELRKNSKRSKQTLKPKSENIYFARINHTIGKLKSTNEFLFLWHLAVYKNPTFTFHLRRSNSELMWKLKLIQVHKPNDIKQFTLMNFKFKHYFFPMKYLAIYEFLVIFWSWCFSLNFFFFFAYFLCVFHFIFCTFKMNSH